MKKSNVICQNCGMHLRIGAKSCPKCDTIVKDQYVNEVLVVDVAHDGEDWDTAREKIDNAIHEAVFHKLKGLKVIHGRGVRRGHTGIIRTKSTSYLSLLANRHNAKLVKDKHTDGAHIVYFNSK